MNSEQEHMSVEEAEKYVRLQDIVARVAGVSLKDTVNVLRALHAFVEDADLLLDAPSIVEQMQRHRDPGDDPIGSLYHKLTSRERIACDVVYLRMLNKRGKEWMKELHH